MAVTLNHLHLKTREPEKTVQFYVDMLGAKVVSQSATGGYRLDLHGLALNVTKFNEQQKRTQMYGMEHLAIDTDDFDALVDKLKNQGVRILEQTTVGGGARRVCFYEGPDGVQLEFIEKKAGS
jgi:catechol 2,3-dioxygenase-like lactoylglutathione lyase family enzyme